MTLAEPTLTADARMGDTALERCVTCSADIFASEHWGQTARLSRAAELGSDFSDLLSPAAVDELVSRRGLRTPFLRMAKDGVVQPASSYTRGGGAGAAVPDQAADDKVLGALGGGSTLVLQGLHRNWPPLVDFGVRLADELGHPIQINAYITPPQSQGFAPHYDTHDVFVLQIAGRKHWTVHPSVVEDPADNQPFDRFRSEIAKRVTEEPLIDTVLEEGDALYLPRGAVHSAQALGETSIHITVGIHPLTRYQLVRFLLDAVQDDPLMRTSLPMGVDLGDPHTLAPLLSDTITALKDALDDVPADRIAAKLATNLMQRTRPEPISPLAQLVAADTLELDSPLKLRGALRCRLDTTPDADGQERLRIVLLDRVVVLSPAEHDAVTLALSGATFTPAELLNRTSEEQLSLARQLLREGVLTPA